MLLAKLKNRLKVVKKRVWRYIARQPKLKFVYGWYYKHSRIDEHIILFESFHGSTVSDSPYYILKELLSREDASKFKIYYSSNKADHKTHKKFLEANHIPAKLVDVQSFEYMKILATAKYLINNSSFPIYYIKKDEQVYLQTWHGTPLKTLGKQMRLGIESMYNVQHNFLQATYLMHPNEFTRDSIMRDYNLEGLYTGKVALSGYPRNSIFLDKEKASKVRNELDLTDKTVYAYMPTWRGTSNHAISMDSYSKEIKTMMDHLDKSLKDNQILYVNFHPILKNSVQLDNYTHIKNFPATVDKYEFLNSVDALITDYSSVFFDFSITRKPIILFMYDFDEYMQDRGMYFDIQELPFIKLYHLKDLSEYLSTEKVLQHSYDSDEYCDKYLKYDSLDAPAKMLDLVLYGKTDDMVVTDYSHNKSIPHNVIYPKKLSATGVEFQTIQAMADKNTIALFEKKWFSKKISSVLYDEYNDAFQYVIITRTPPRTYFEEFLSKLGNQNVIDMIEKRFQKNIFPNLNITGPYNRCLHATDPGCQLSIDDTLDANISLNGNKLVMNLQQHTEGCFCKLFILDFKNTVLWKRELTKEEQSSRTIQEDFSSYSKEMFSMEKFIHRQRIIIESYHKEQDVYTYYYLTDSAKSNIAAKRNTQFDRGFSYYEPITLRPAQDDKDKNILIPYLTSKNSLLSFCLCNEENILDESTKATIVSLKSKKTGPSILLSLPIHEGMELKDVVLRYRSADSYDISIPYTVTTKGNHLMIHAKMNFLDYTLREIYWDFRVIVEQFNRTFALKARIPNQRLKYRFYLANTDYDAGNNHIVFPYYTKGGYLAFCYREASPYDSYSTKLKEFLAIGLYLLGGPFWKRKRIWLVYEKFCSMAQDNGYYFFKYCMENLSESEKKHIYYVIDKNAVDYEKIKQYDDHIIQFMSLKHCLYLLCANIYIGSDSKTHLFSWRCKTSLIRSRMGKVPIYFLQHGVTALKQVHPLFGKRGSSPMTYFTATSQFEQDIIVNQLGYNPAKVPIVGFTRWDVLEDTSVDTDRIILLMPTWRSWLEEVSDEDFLSSDYYKNYASFLQNQHFNDMLEKYHTRLIFYIHPKFANYLKNFSDTGKHVELITFGQTPLNEIMKRCHMLITDYSSVCWDVYYLGKPVVFYQFDYEKYRDVHGSYVDMEHDLFGRRAVNEEELLNHLEECMATDFVELEKDREARPYYFEYIDNDNSKRTYQFLIQQNF